MLAHIESHDIEQINRLSLSAASAEVALQRSIGDLIEDALRAACRSAHTRRSYMTSIGFFVQYVEQHRAHLLPEELREHWKPFAEITLDERKALWHFNAPAAILRLVDASLVDGFRAYREQIGDSANSATARMYAVRSFLSVAYRDGVITDEQAHQIGLKVFRQRQKRDIQPVGRRLAPAEVRALRQAVNTSTAKGKRDLAILDTMLYLGLRREEVAQLDRANFKQDGGRWWLVLKGKGDKKRRLKVHDSLYKSLTAWNEVAQQQLGTEGHLFRSIRRGDHVAQSPINASVVGRLVAEYGHIAGLAPLNGENRLSPHDLRRTAARNAYDNGAGLLRVQLMLGHSDPKTTSHYIGIGEDDDTTAIDFVRY